MSESGSFAPISSAGASAEQQYEFEDHVESIGRATVEDETPAAPAPQIPMPATTEKKAKFSMEFTGDSPLDADKDVDAKDEGYLHRLAEKPTVSLLPLRQSCVVWAIVVLCERMIGEKRGPRAPTTIADLRRLLMAYDDFALDRRPREANAYDIDGGTTGVEEGLFNDEEVRFDRRHQINVFIARMRLLHAMRIAQPDTWNASVLFGDKDSPGKQVSDEKLFRWAKEQCVCHENLLQNGKLALHSCSLEELWRTLLMLINAWPRLTYDPPLVRLFDELRCRVAFFMCYREVAFEFQVDSDSDSDSDDESKTDDRVLGLNLDMFGLTDLSGVLVPRRQPPKQAKRSLIDNWQLATRVKAEKTYAHVNMDFIDECERILHSMQMSLRAQAGFRVRALKTDQCGACGGENVLFKAQQKRTIFSLITPDDEKHLLDVLSEAIGGPSASILDEQFKTEIFDMYIQPGELAQFKEYHPQETETSQACISRCRLEDFKVLSKRYLDKTAKEAWIDGNLRNALLEPAHQLLAGLALNFLMRQDVAGLKFDYYYVQLSHMDAFSYEQSSTGEYRQLLCHVYEQLLTTSTLRLRYKLMPQSGAGSNHAELNYEHPLIVRSLCSHLVLYRGHLHACRSLEHAFLSWIAIMCLDKHIGGVTHNYKPLQPFAMRLLPSLAVPLRRAYELTLERQKKWTQLGETPEPEADFPPWFTTHFA
jgi:hypothetical protein